MIEFFPSNYTVFVTTEHKEKPKYLETLTVTIQPFTDLQTTIFNLPELFDLDGAIGAQLDAVGTRIGLTRFVKLPVPQIFFSWDEDDARGWDNAPWFAGSMSIGGTSTLDDDDYRILLRARIMSNEWDGTIPGAQAAYDELFAPRGVHILIQDTGYMRMYLAIVGGIIDDVTMGLFIGDYLLLKPAGVQMFKVTQSVPDAPLFGFDIDNGNISGYDVGAWGLITPEL
jgi:hypothetical protein